MIRFPDVPIALDWVSSALPAGVSDPAACACQPRAGRAIVRLPRNRAEATPRGWSQRPAVPILGLG